MTLIILLKEELGGVLSRFVFINEHHMRFLLLYATISIVLDAPVRNYNWISFNRSVALDFQSPVM